MITFAPGVSVRIFSIPLATILWAVSVWSDVACIAITVETIRERDPIGPHDTEALLCVEVQTEGERPIHRGELARYLEGALERGYMADVYRGRVRVEWFPPPYTPH